MRARDPRTVRRGRDPGRLVDDGRQGLQRLVTADGVASGWNFVQNLDIFLT
jgi:hypothetical protein